MTDRNIICIECNCNMGIIRDAKLRKDILYICNNCHKQLHAIITMKKNSDKKSPTSDFGDIFNDILNDKKYNEQ